MRIETLAKIVGAVLLVGGLFMTVAKDRAMLYQHDGLIKEMRQDQKEMRDAVSTMAPQVNFLYHRASRGGSNGR